MLEADPDRVSKELQRMDQKPYELDAMRRIVVLNGLRERCRQQRWSLLAAHVRASHVHLVIEGEATPERIMNDLKAYASRCLNQRECDEPGRKRWARHGSTRWLWKPEHVSTAIRYVIDAQGEPMAAFEGVEG